MKPILWLSSISLASTACTYNYATWVPHDGDTFAQDVGQALPGLDYNEVEALNPGININKIYPGRTYKVPYDASMEIIPPATWSDDCPRALQLNQNAYTKSTSSPASSVASRGSSDSTATSTDRDSTVTPSKIQTETDVSASSFSISLPKASTSDSATAAIPTTAPTDSYSISAPAATGAGSSLVCWRETHPEAAQFSSNKESRVNFIESFCNRLDNLKVNAQHPTEEAPYDDVWIGMQMLPSCPNHAIGADSVDTCRAVLEHINDKCIEAGGVFQTSCMLYYFVKLGT
ncbi:hypothetical protein LRP88_14912 [Fusarium phalaenopsidis]